MQDLMHDSLLSGMKRIGNTVVPHMMSPKLTGGGSGDPEIGHER